MRSGIIYKRKLKVECPEKGFCYIGDTLNEVERQNSWDNPNNLNYGGLKITDARQKYGVGDDVWDYTVLERYYSDNCSTDEEFRKKLHEREEDYIRIFDSTENGFNTSKGGSGCKGTQKSEKEIKDLKGKPVTAIHINGSSVDFSSIREASNVTGVCEADIKNSIRYGKMCKGDLVFKERELPDSQSNTSSNH